MAFEIPGLSKLKGAFSRQAETPGEGTGTEGALLDGRFRIVRKIGSGGMGSVYLARQISMDRDVAVKMLNPDKIDDEDARSRFKIEAAAVSRLKSPYTVSVFDFGETEDGQMYLVMELLEGKPLSTVLEQEGRLPSDDVQSIAEQMLESLAEAHAAGVLHRDLKPENVFFRRTRGSGIFVKVLDFGIAKVVHGPLSSKTWPGLVFGTPAYMSPEQVMGRKLDERSDLYSLAVMMFELLTGQLPINGKTPIEIGVRKVRSMPPHLSDVLPDADFPEAADSFFQSALHPDPDKRPTNAHEFLSEMKTAFSGTSDAAVPFPGKTGQTANKPARPTDAASSNDGSGGPGENKPGFSKRDLLRPDDTPAERPVAAYSVRTGDGRRDVPPVRNDDSGLQDPGRAVTKPLKDAPQPGSGMSDAPAANAPATPAADRRSSPRLPKLSSVRCYYDGVQYNATAADLSISGGFMHATWLPAVGHRITLAFTCPGTTDYNIGILGEVVRVADGSAVSEAIPGAIKGFAVRWLRLRARGELSCVTRFFASTLGTELKTSLPEASHSRQWEYSFTESRFI